VRAQRRRALRQLPEQASREQASTEQASRALGGAPDREGAAVTDGQHGQRREPEGQGVERERERGRAEEEQHAAEGGPEDDAGTADGGPDGVGAGQVGVVDEARGDRGDARHIRGGGRGRRGRDHRGEHDRQPGRGHRGQHEHEPHSDQVAGDHDTAAVEPVGQDSAERTESHDRHDPGRGGGTRP
jgi:hypothetical protein